MEVKSVQLKKVSFPIVVTLFGRVIEIKPQPLKAPFPIVITLFGMVTEVKPLQP